MNRFLAGPMFLPHHRIELLAPLPVMVAELAVAVAVGMVPAGTPPTAGSKSRFCAAVLYGLSRQSGWGMCLPASRRSGGKQPCPPIRSRSILAGSGQLNPAALAWVTYSLTVLAETRAALGDFPVRQPHLIFQSQNFFYFSHG